MVNLDIVGASEILRPLVFILLGIAIYTIFIYNFYRFLARKDIFALNLTQYNRVEHPVLAKIMHVILYFIEYLLLFPIFTFFWFIVLTLLLSFLIRQPTVQTILLVSVALVGAVRIIAYYKEVAAKELAKILPFTLLGIYLSDVAQFSFTRSLEILKNILNEINIIIIYLIFIIILEFLLRIGYLLFGPGTETPEDEIERI